VEVVAVASRDGARADEYARVNGIPRAWGSYDALLADEAVDAVYVALPNSLHVKWAVRALEAGKHVLCEKPLAATEEGAEEAFAAAVRSGRVLVEGFMYRHNPQTRRLRELVSAGVVGRPRLVRAVFTFQAEGDRNVRLDPELGGGSLLDLGCYCLSGARLLLGEPERLWATQVVGPTGVDELFAATLAFAEGAVAQFHCGLVLPFRQELEVVGEDGRLVVVDPWLVRSPGIELVRGDHAETIAVEAADSYRLELDDFAAAVRGDHEPLLGREDGLAQARGLEALGRAARDGTAVTV
jgi:predicted dehydrogenase